MTYLNSRVRYTRSYLFRSKDSTFVSLRYLIDRGMYISTFLKVNDIPFQAVCNSKGISIRQDLFHIFSNLW